MSFKDGLVTTLGHNKKTYTIRVWYIHLHFIDFSDAVNAQVNMSVWVLNHTICQFEGSSDQAGGPPVTWYKQSIPIVNSFVLTAPFCSLGFGMG